MYRHGLRPTPETQSPIRRLFTSIPRRWWFSSIITDAASDKISSQ